MGDGGGWVSISACWRTEFEKYVTNNYEKLFLIIYKIVKTDKPS
jgi:hypothetical protein